MKLFAGDLSASAATTLLAMNQKIIELLNSIQPAADFAGSQNFLEDGLIDSVDVIMITTAIEDEFGVSVPGTEITPENYASVDRLAALITKCMHRPER
jgi:acyl carrier protein